MGVLDCSYQISCVIRDVTEDSTLVQVLDIDVQTINNHPLSQVTSGSLRLRGSLARGRICKVTLPDEDGLGPSTVTKYDIYNNEELERVDYVPDLDISDTCGSTYVLPVKRVDYDENNRARGLLLQLTGQRVREFRRVGTYHVRDLQAVTENCSTRYVPSVGGDPLSADDVWLDGFKLDGKTLDTLTII